MGGEAGFQPRSGAGSCFWFTLPLAPSTGDTINLQLPPRAVLNRRYRVMLVDDTPLNLVLLKHMARCVGLDITPFGSGADAMDSLRNDVDRPDLVVTDVWMPRMDGFAFASAVRALDPRIPVIAYTADGNPDTQRRAAASGMREVCQKPMMQRCLINICNTYGDGTGRGETSPGCVVDGRRGTDCEVWLEDCE